MGIGASFLPLADRITSWRWSLTERGHCVYYLRHCHCCMTYIPNHMKLKCERCEFQYYCSPHCQRIDWDLHKSMCVRIEDKCRPLLRAFERVLRRRLFLFLLLWYVDRYIRARYPCRQMMIKVSTDMKDHIMIHFNKQLKPVPTSKLVFAFYIEYDVVISRSVTALFVPKPPPEMDKFLTKLDQTLFPRLNPLLETALSKGVIMCDVSRTSLHLCNMFSNRNSYRVTNDLYLLLPK